MTGPQETWIVEACLCLCFKWSWNEWKRVWCWRILKPWKLIWFIDKYMQWKWSRLNEKYRRCEQFLVNMETQILVSDYQTRRSPNSLVRLTLLMNIIRLVCGISSTEKTHLLGMAKKRQKQEQEISTSFKVFLTTWAFVENGLFSGLRAGWSALVYILKQEHIYADLCLGNTTGNSSKCICHGETSNTSDSYSCSSSSAPNF